MKIKALKEIGRGEMFFICLLTIVFSALMALSILGDIVVYMNSKDLQLYDEVVDNFELKETEESVTEESKKAIKSWWDDIADR